MAIQYTWTFNPLDVTYESASMQNIVTNVHWQAHATMEGTSSLGVSGSFHASNIGTVGLSSPDGENFTSFDDLTHEIVYGWVSSSMGESADGVAQVDQIEASLSSSLALQLNPTRGTKLPPWV